MSILPDYVSRNREHWTELNADFERAGEKSWASPEITWGMFDIPESELGILADIPLEGARVIELGCGTGYVSGWLARRGARPVGIDITPAQLDSARRFQERYGIAFPLMEGSAEEVPLPDNSFDLAISEYGASIWCDPYKWIPEAVRLLRPGGRLVFLRHTPLAMCCSPDVDPISTQLVRPWFGLHRVDYDGGTEFSLGTGEMFRLLKSLGLLVEVSASFQAPKDAETRYDHFEKDWPHQWPIEEIWRAVLQS